MKCKEQIMTAKDVAWEELEEIYAILKRYRAESVDDMETRQDVEALAEGDAKALAEATVKLAVWWVKNHEEGDETLPRLFRILVNVICKLEQGEEVIGANTQAQMRNKVTEVVMDESVMGETAMDQVVVHLEALGYEVCQDDGDGTRIMATHPTKSNIMVRRCNGGLVLGTAWKANASAKRDLLGYLGFINVLNRLAAVTHISANSQGDLLFEAYLPGDYENGRFSMFLEAWDHDTTDLLYRKVAELAAKYLE